MPLFKAYIRVVKELAKDSWMGMGSVDIVREPLIEADNKDHVKQILVSKYPQFFQNGKIYERQTKDDAQFFYVVIYPLFNFEQELINEGQWTCSYCGQVHENKYVSKPIKDIRTLGEEFLFCKSEENICIKKYKEQKYAGVDLRDDEFYINRNSPNYIYKCTEKSTGKCYIGKTKNAPFFRWWNHLTHSNSRFGVYLRQTKLSDWTFEVLEILPSEACDKDVFSVESKYIVQYDSINNGFNSLISDKKVLEPDDITLFDQPHILETQQAINQNQ